MSKQANTKAIGAFVMVALALAVVAIVIFGSGKFFAKSDQFVAYFQGSVKGLRVGAPVVFRGVRIGEVTKIVILVDRRDQSYKIPVILEIVRDSFLAIGPDIHDRKLYFQELIRTGMRAQLQLQSFVTGQLMINIDFYPDRPAKFEEGRKLDLPADTFEIPTIETSLQKIEKSLEDVPIGDIIKSAGNSLKGIESIVTSPELTKSLEYLKQTLKDIRDLARHVDEKIDPFSDDFGQTLQEARMLMRNVDRQVDPLATSFRKTSDSAGDALEDARKLINNFSGEVTTLAADLAKTLQKAEETLSSVNGAIEEGSPLRFQVETAISELVQAARSIRILASYLERHPEALLRGKSETGGQ